MSVDLRWILGFDASCGRCSEIAKAAKNAAGEKLEVLPLEHPDIQRWREESLGANAPWVPTLIRVGATQVHSWTGLAMGMRLLTRLGPVGAIKLFKALGEVSRASSTTTSSEDSLGRRRFFKVGAGVGIAFGIVLTGKAPALADEAGKARAWVAANRDRLPQSYTAFSKHTMPYRRAIYTELNPAIRSRLWTEHIAQYRQGHPNLSPEQQQILSKLETYFRNESAVRARPIGVQQEEDERLGREVVNAFGEDEARALVATLGPVEPSGEPDTAPAVACECSRGSDYCRGICSGLPSCTPSLSGCGFGWGYACDGMCTISCGFTTAEAAC